MGTREQDPRIKALYDSGKHVYSFSRLDSMNTCPLGAWYTYYKDIKGVDNVYSSLGGRVHDTLEAITNGNATTDDLLPAMNDELEDLDLQGIEFPKSRDGSDSIHDRWVANMTYFCTHYKPPKGKFKTEELLIYDAGNNRALIGYADLIRVNKDGSLNLYDYKTSSMYRGEDLKTHGRQLLIYKMALEQAGYKVNKVAWIFLKYSQISYDVQKVKKFRKEIKTTENCKIYDKIAKEVEKRMRWANIDELDIEYYMNKFQQTGDINCLPEDISYQFKIVPLVREYEATDELIEECKEFINKTADAFESLNANVQPKAIKINEGNSFFCNQLCNHRDICPALAKYQERRKNTYYKDNDIF